MVDAYFFTMEMLNNLELKDLKTLADYYQIKYAKNITINTLIRRIFSEQKNLHQEYSGFVPNDGEPQMSVRVRRIMESSKGG